MSKLTTKNKPFSDEHQIVCKFPVYSHVSISKQANYDPIAIKVRKIISCKIRSVYVELCGLSLFRSRDVFERGSHEYTIHPNIDSMGVVFTAIELMRAMCPGDSAEIAYDPEAHLQLTLSCRVKMAAAFFMSYKLKSEDGWRGQNMPVFVLGKFVATYELAGTKRSQLSEILMNAELSILSDLNVHSVSEFNLHSIIEYKLEYLLQEKLITPLAACMSMSVSSFYLYLFRCVTHTEFLEEAAAKKTGDTLALAMVVLCMASLSCSFTVDVHNLPKLCRIEFDHESLRLALEIVNARLENSKHLTIGFPSLCSTPVANKVREMLLQTLRHWKDTEIVCCMN